MYGRKHSLFYLQNSKYVHILCSETNLIIYQQLVTRQTLIEIIDKEIYN
jgi:hypothetical protein